MGISNKVSERQCSFCSSIEGKPRLIGDYIVELKEIILDDEKKLACQACNIKNSRIRDLRSVDNKNNLRERLKQLLRFIGF